MTESTLTTIPPREVAGPDAPDYPRGKLVFCDEEEYFRASGINSHGLITLDRSPAHYYAKCVEGVDEEERESLRFGRLFHHAILMPEDFLARKTLMPKFDKRTKAGKEGHQDFMAMLKPDQVIVTEKDATMLTGMIKSIERHPVARGLLNGGVREPAVWWDDPLTKELCKAKIDLIQFDKKDPDTIWLVDLKTCTDARENQFLRAFFKYGYDIQLMHYRAALKDGLQHKKVRVAIIAIEKEPPYELGVYPIGDTIVEYAHTKWRGLLNLYNECRLKNDWPGYTREAKTLELPFYLMTG